MKKIPTLFKRDPDDLKHVLQEVTPGCEWVLAGEGVATRKYDGTCVKFDGERWWARREVKAGKIAPPEWRQEDYDNVTGKRVGWEPMENSSFHPWLEEAIRMLAEPRYEPGTYELIGPRINRNPEDYGAHDLIPHGATVFDPDPPRDYLGLRSYLLDLPHEGIVWHHPDGRMAKLKRRDFQ
jgi:hypothetical protein